MITAGSTDKVWSCQFEVEGVKEFFNTLSPKITLRVETKKTLHNEEDFTNTIILYNNDSATHFQWYSKEESKRLSSSPKKGGRRKTKKMRKSNKRRKRK